MSYKGTPHSTAQSLRASYYWRGSLLQRQVIADNTTKRDEKSSLSPHTPLNSFKEEELNWEADISKSSAESVFSMQVLTPNSAAANTTNSLLKSLVEQKKNEEIEDYIIWAEEVISLMNVKTVNLKYVLIQDLWTENRRDLVRTECCWNYFFHNVKKIDSVADLYGK